MPSPDEVHPLAVLGRVSDAVDPLRDYLTDLSWEPPQIVVMGNENSGKSTLLSRLCMMPFVPTDKKLCTRMVIKLCVRCTERKVLRLEILNLHHDRIGVGIAIVLRTERG